MNNKEYLTKLLGLCTSAQISLYNRMYPDGPSKSQVARATSQVEQTLKKLNDLTTSINDVHKENSIVSKEYEQQISDLNKTIQGLKEDLIVSNREISHLSASEINVANADIQRQLHKLAALEAGGVDNWQWYAESLQNYEE